MQSELKGLGVPLAIPFHRHGTIDFTSLEKLIENVIHAGVDYIAILNNFSESNTLSEDEKAAILDFTIEVVAQRIPLIAGVSGNNTQVLIDTLKKNNLQDLQAIIPFCPYITRVKQKGIFYHYKEIAAVSPVPIFIYNTFLKGSSIITAETVLNLAHSFRNIEGYIEDYPSLTNIFSIIDRKPENFTLIMGDDIHLIPAMAMGVDNMMPVMANAYPSIIRDVYRLCVAQHYENARDQFKSLIPIIEIMHRDDKISTIKAILDIQGICSNNLRLPLIKLKKSLLYELQTLLKEAELMKENVLS
ncbi:MAG: dihydrodipicolinate synthase family protein [Bacteroidales bacterium]|nr:dihydrodipicolinate synthase family protein [Bacteroidales bacterium]MCF8388035.1 dihydrodipicolinate synthase family protein [Bacteroidales bacterium]MCF8398112.1 dihydrodipicolinate synthase family protein [Bacteroidales bacterium]